MQSSNLTGNPKTKFLLLFLSALRRPRIRPTKKKLLLTLPLSDVRCRTWGHYSGVNPNDVYTLRQNTLVQNTLVQNTLVQNTLGQICKKCPDNISRCHCNNVSQSVTMNHCVLNL